MISDVVDALPARPLRRRWSDDVKAQIVAESYASGAVVSEVARRHEISPQHLAAWRKAARHGLLKPPDGRADGEEARRNGRDPGSEFVKRRGFFRGWQPRPRASVRPDGRPARD